MIDEIKQPIFGNWYIEEELGSGSFGTVYKIKRETFGKTQYSAMKVIRIPQDKSEKKRLMSEGMDEASITGYYDQFVKDFSKEIELMAELQGNTNIVGYTDHIIEENEDGIGYTIYIRMEYLTPLDEYLISENTVKEMSLDEVIKLGVDICRALEICATKNIIHRDIKPDNIFVSENGDFELGDFGIARQLESTQSGLSKKGTYTYMAPEIYNGQAYNSTVDIYSLGIVLYRLLNKNRAPFLPLAPQPIKYTDKENALIRRMKGEPIPAIAGIDERINEIVLKACACNPKERYRTAGEMKAALLALEIDEVNIEKANPLPIDEDDDKTLSPFDEIINEDTKDGKDVIDELIDDEDDELESTVGPFDHKFKESSTDDERSSEESFDEEDKDEYDETVGPFDKIEEDISNDIDKDDKNENKSNTSSNSKVKAFIKNKKFKWIVSSVSLIVIVFIGIMTIPYFYYSNKADSFDTVKLNCSAYMYSTDSTFSWGSKLGEYANTDEFSGQEVYKQFDEGFFPYVSAQNISLFPQKAKDCYVTNVFDNDSSSSQNVDFIQDDCSLWVGDNLNVLFYTYGKPTYHTLNFLGNQYYGYNDDKYELLVCANPFGTIKSIELRFIYADEYVSSVLRDDYVSQSIAIYSLPKNKKILCIGLFCDEKFGLQEDYSFIQDLPDNSITDIFIGEAVKNIPTNYFNDYNFGTSKFTKVKSICLPSTIESIGQNAFTINDGLQNIYSYDVETGKCTPQYR